MAEEKKVEKEKKVATKATTKKTVKATKETNKDVAKETINITNDMLGELAEGITTLNKTLNETYKKLTELSGTIKELIGTMTLIQTQNESVVKDNITNVSPEDVLPELSVMPLSDVIVFRNLAENLEVKNMRINPERKRVMGNLRVMFDGEIEKRLNGYAENI